MEHQQFNSERARNDYRLVCRARDDGDNDAFAALMQSYRLPVYVMLLRMSKCPEDAEDLTLETFCKAFTKLKMYSPSSPFSTWLYHIATNTYIDFYRKKKGVVETVDIDDSSLSVVDDKYEYPLTSPIGNPEAEFVREQRKEMLRKIVSQMKPKYRRMIELRYFEECTYEEIAEQMALPINTVRTQLARAHDLLHSLLTGKEDIM